MDIKKDGTGKHIESTSRSKKSYLTQIPTPTAYWNADGRSNSDPDRNTLPDLTGNGYDLLLNNFSFALQSGYGGFEWDFTTWSSNSRQTFTRTDNTYTIFSQNLFTIGFQSGIYKYVNVGESIHLKFKVTNCPTVDGLLFWFGDPSRASNRYVIIDHDGEYEVTFTNTGTVSRAYSFMFNQIIDLSESPVVIELIPDYPGYLLFDGIDDFCTSIQQLPEIPGNNRNLTIIYDLLVLSGNVNYTPYFSLYQISDVNTNHTSLSRGSSNIIDRVVNQSSSTLNSIPNASYALANQHPNNMSVYYPSDVLEITSITYSRAGLRDFIIGAFDYMRWAGLYAKIALRGIAIWHDYLSPEQVNEAYAQIQDNTLIPQWILQKGTWNDKGIWDDEGLWPS